MKELIEMLGLIIGVLFIGGLFFGIIYVIIWSHGVKETQEEAVKKGFGEWVIKDKEIVFKWKEGKKPVQ